METLVNLIVEVYKYHSAGGGCHIVTDDLNISNDDIKWSLENLETYERDSCPEQIEAERTCLKALLAVNKTERENTINEFWEHHYPYIGGYKGEQWKNHL